MTKNIQDYTNGEAVLEATFANPNLKVRPRAANPNPSHDDVVKVLVSEVERIVTTSVAEQIKPKIQSAIENVEMLDGSWDEAEDQNAWESALDDQVEEAIVDFVEILSADWLGKNTIDSAVHQEGGVDRFALSMGKEVYKQIAHSLDKSPAKIMEALGITQDLVSSMLDQHIAGEGATEAADTKTVEDVLRKVIAHTGKDFDILTVADDLDLASDGDEGLAAGAAARLGLDVSDLGPLEDEKSIFGEDAMDVWVGLLNSIAAEEDKPKPSKKSKTKAKAKKEAEDTEEKFAVSSDKLRGFKDACTFKDADMAGGCGVSRATFNNWVNGKAKAELSGEGYAFLRDELVVRINLMTELLSELDMVDHEGVL